MAKRRMFTPEITDSDAFLDMPTSTQNLYFHSCMKADDDGFVNNIKSIMRNVKSSEDDLKVLVSKNFVIPFKSGVFVIKHWRMHNYLRGDRYTETKYLDEKSQLVIKENGAYSLGIQNDNQVATSGIPTVDTGKVRLGKDSIGKKESKKDVRTFDEIINAFTEHEPLRNELIEFIKMRKLIKKPLTNHSLQLLLTAQNKGLFDLSGGNHDIALAIVRQSIMNSWQGFFPLKDNMRQQVKDTFLDMLAKA